MTERTEFDVRDFGAIGDGTASDTAALQSAIDAAARVGGRVVVSSGRYLIGSLFLSSGIEFHVSDDAVLLATTDDSEYPTVFSRVAGIEMDGPAALINLFDGHDVAITGTGLIDGRGQHWWDLYWGPDGKGGLRAEYETRGLRWASDYDVRRPRVILIHESTTVLIQGIRIKRSPFWTVHLCYSSDVRVDGIRIDESFGPSTDGIDVDSCSRVLIENCAIACADDNIVMKSGRDADGLRVGRVCEDIEIRNCLLGEGLGLAFGSDLSGGIRNVRIHDVEFIGTDYGVRIKSSRARGGYVKDVSAERITMRNVAFPLSFLLNWYPAFNSIAVPEDHVGPVPDSWRILTLPLPDPDALTVVDGFALRDVTSVNDPDYEGPSRAFDIDGYPEQPVVGLTLERVRIAARELGKMVGVEDVQLVDCALTIERDVDPENDLYDHRTHHEWREHEPLPELARR